MLTRFEHAIVDPIGAIASPFVGIIATPILLLGAALKTVEAWFHGRNVPEEHRNLDINTYEPNLDRRDLTWLKSERSRLLAKDDATACLEIAKRTALLIIPIFGYISVFYGRDKDVSECHAKKISWLKWHIDSLEGRHDKNSLRYALGWNLPD